MHSTSTNQSSVKQSSVKQSSLEAFAYFWPILSLARHEKKATSRKSKTWEVSIECFLSTETWQWALATNHHSLTANVAYCWCLSPIFISDVCCCDVFFRDDPGCSDKKIEQWAATKTDLDRRSNDNHMAVTSHRSYWLAVYAPYMSAFLLLIPSP